MLNCCYVIIHTPTSCSTEKLKSGEQCCLFRRITEHRILVASNFLRKLRMPEAWNASWLDLFLSFDNEEPSLTTMIIWSLVQCLPLGRMDRTPGHLQRDGSSRRRITFYVGDQAVDIAVSHTKFPNSHQQRTGLFLSKKMGHRNGEVKPLHGK